LVGSLDGPFGDLSAAVAATVLLCSLEVWRLRLPLDGLRARPAPSSDSSRASEFMTDVGVVSQLAKQQHSAPYFHETKLARPPLAQHSLALRLQLDSLTPLSTDLGLMNLFSRHAHGAPLSAALS
jgi:hypothetical protein